MSWGDLVAIVGGLGAGFLSGTIGIGGGLLFVPTMTVGLRLSQAEAQGTSLVAIIPTAIVGGVTHFRRGNVLPRPALGVPPTPLPQPPTLSGNGYPAPATMPHPSVTDKPSRPMPLAAAERLAALARSPPRAGRVASPRPLAGPHAIAANRHVCPRYARISLRTQVPFHRWRGLGLVVPATDDANIGRTNACVQPNAQVHRAGATAPDDT